jgi:hypothetical protein
VYIGLDLVVTKTSYDSEMVKMVAYEDELVKLSEIISAYEASQKSGVVSALGVPTLGLFGGHEGKQVSGIAGPDGNVQLVKASAPTGNTVRASLILNYWIVIHSICLHHNRRTQRCHRCVMAIISSS